MVTMDDLLQTFDAPPSKYTSGPEVTASGDAENAEIVSQPTEAELDEDRAKDASDAPDAQIFAASNFWPANDADSPEYAHLGDAPAPASFAAESADIETLIAANRFDPHGHAEIIALAIRGSVLQAPHEQEKKTSICLQDLRPNHADFRCTLGFYYRSEKKLTLFTGSTVPCPLYMKNYLNRVNGRPHDAALPDCNMLPTGCYVFRVGAHNNGSIKPALRMTDPDNLSADAIATVLRTEDDLTYGFGAKDRWDKTTPFDNVHCSYFLNFIDRYEACFSSAGCLTVRGRKDPSDQWSKFQAQLNALGQGKRCDLILLTGRELAIAAKLRADGSLTNAELLRSQLARLRVGSQGDEVRLLQQKLGFTTPSGYFGPATKVVLAEHQKREGIRADGIYSPALDEKLKWGVLRQPSA